MEKSLDYVMYLEKKYRCKPSSHAKTSFFSPITALGCYLLDNGLGDVMVNVAKRESVSSHEQWRYEDVVREWKNRILPLWKKFHSRVLLRLIPVYILQFVPSVLWCWWVIFWVMKIQIALALGGGIGMLLALLVGLLVINFWVKSILRDLVINGVYKNFSNTLT